MENISVELKAKELLAIIGALVKAQMSFGVEDDELTALIGKLQTVASENISAEETIEILKSYLAQ